MKGLIEELCPRLSLVSVHCDSQSAIHLIKIATEANPTDMMTITLPCAKFFLGVDLVALTPFNI